jgi:hypothetical protein
MIGVALYLYLVLLRGSSGDWRGAVLMFCSILITPSALVAGRTVAFMLIVVYILSLFLARRVGDSLLNNISFFNVPLHLFPDSLVLDI